MKDQSGGSTENKGIREGMWSLELDRDDIDLEDQGKDLGYILRPA